MEKYNFYGWEHADAPAMNEEYAGIQTPVDLYDALSNIWCADTCAPRMRSSWTPENKTMGQCSITAFLAQDIFGGKVYGWAINKGYPTAAHREAITQLGPTPLHRMTFRLTDRQLTLF